MTMFGWFSLTMVAVVFNHSALRECKFWDLLQIKFWYYISPVAWHLVYFLQIFLQVFHLTKTSGSTFSLTVIILKFKNLFRSSKMSIKTINNKLLGNIRNFHSTFKTFYELIHHRSKFTEHTRTLPPHSPHRGEGIWWYILYVIINGKFLHM